MIGGGTRDVPSPVAFRKFFDSNSQSTVCYTKFVTTLDVHTVDGSEIPRPTTWDVQNPLNNGINYQPQLVHDFFHQQYHSITRNHPSPEDFLFRFVFFLPNPFAHFFCCQLVREALSVATEFNMATLEMPSNWAAKCNGYYRMSSQKILFKNRCLW